MVGAAATGSDRANTETKRGRTQVQHDGDSVKQSVVCITANFKR